jgi:hypothetical protein
MESLRQGVKRLLGDRADTVDLSQQQQNFLNH